MGGAATSIPASPQSNTAFTCGGLDGSVPFVFHAFEWQNGVEIDLGALTPVVDNCSNGVSVNAKGEIAGSSENGVIDPVLGIKEVRAVLWKDGEIKNLGTFGGNNSIASQINNRGQVAGSALNALPDPFSLFDLPFFGSSNGTQTRAFLWHDGEMEDLDTLGGPDSFGDFINESGQVAGISYTNSTANEVTGLPTLHPFLWQNGRMKDLGTLGGFGSILPTSPAPVFVTGLSNRGQVIGVSPLAGDQVADPFLWDDGKLIDLFTDTIGGNPITANAINDAGEIVGGGAFPSQVFDAYLWRNGVATDLGTLPGDCFSQAFAINSRGQVVGQSVACDFSTRSFLWENGSMIDLNSFVPPGSGLQLVEAVAINDRGQIAGDEVPPGCTGVPQGQDSKCGHAYVLIPCDDDQSDGEGCEDGAEVTTAAMPAPIVPSSITSEQSSVIARETAARIHRRFGRNRGLAPWLPKQFPLKY